MPDAVGGNLRQARNSVRDFFDVIEGEIYCAFLRRSQGVQDGVRRAAHGHVQSHRVVESILVSDVAWQDGFIFLAVVATAQIHDRGTGLLEETTAVGVGGQGGAVARQGQAQSFGEAVHGVSGEHT